MSSEKKGKRRQKKNSQVAPFVTRFRVQPPEAHSSSESSSSHGAPKFFHWKYNEEDSIITDDAASIPVYPDQTPTSRTTSQRFNQSAANAPPTSNYAPHAQRWVQEIHPESTPVNTPPVYQRHPQVPPNFFLDMDPQLRQQQRQQQLETLYKQRGLPIPAPVDPSTTFNKMALADAYAQHYVGQPTADITTYLPFLSPNFGNRSATPVDRMEVDSDNEQPRTELTSSKVLPAIPEKRIPLGAQHISFPDFVSPKYSSQPIGGSFTPSQHSAFKPIPAQKPTSPNTPLEPVSRTAVCL